MSVEITRSKYPDPWSTVNILAKKSYLFHSQKIAEILYFFHVLRGIFTSRAVVRGKWSATQPGPKWITKIFMLLANPCKLQK